LVLTDDGNSRINDDFVSDAPGRRRRCRWLSWPCSKEIVNGPIYTCDICAAGHAPRSSFDPFSPRGLSYDRLAIAVRFTTRYNLPFETLPPRRGSAFFSVFFVFRFEVFRLINYIRHFSVVSKWEHFDGCGFSTGCTAIHCSYVVACPISFPEYTFVNIPQHGWTNRRSTSVFIYFQTNLKELIFSLVVR